MSWTTAYLSEETTKQAVRLADETISSAVELWFVALVALVFIFTFIWLFVWSTIKQSKQRDLDRDATVKAINKWFDDLKGGLDQLNTTFKEHSDGDEKQMEKIQKEFWKIANTILPQDIVENVLVLNVSSVAIQKRAKVRRRIEINHVVEREQEFREEIKAELEILTGTYRQVFKKIKTDLWNMDDWYVQRGFPDEKFAIFLEKLLKVFLDPNDTIDNKIAYMESLQKIALNEMVNQLRQDYSDWIIVSALSINDKKIWK